MTLFSPSRHAGWLIPAATAPDPGRRIRAQRAAIQWRAVCRFDHQELTDVTLSFFGPTDGDPRKIEPLRRAVEVTR